MKKILLFAFGALLLVTLCTSCTSSKRFDTAAEDRGVKSLSEQVVEAIKADADFQTLTYKAHKDEIVWVSNKKGRKGWQIQAYNPNPIMSKFERFVRLRWLHKDVSFVGSFKSVKLTDDEQESILEALQPLFDKLQKDYIEKTSKKYHQVEGPGDRGADDVNDDQLNSTFPLLFQKGIFVTCISPLYDYHSLTFSLFGVFVYLLICVFVMGVVTVYITDAKGVKHTILVPSDGPDSIMDLAEKQGLELPYSCRSGACYSCCATVNAGKEFLEQNKTGEQLIDVEPDEFLCCIGGIKPDAFTESPDAPQGRVIDLTMLN